MAEVWPGHRFGYPSRLDKRTIHPARDCHPGRQAAGNARCRARAFSEMTYEITLEEKFSITDGCWIHHHRPGASGSSWPRFELVSHGTSDRHERISGNSINSAIHS